MVPIVELKKNPPLLKFLNQIQILSGKLEYHATYS
jgi:hypothetical protein